MSLSSQNFMGFTALVALKYTFLSLGVVELNA